MSKNILFIILTIVLSAGAIFGQTSAFTYQGRLTDGGTPANGNYDLQFALYEAADGNNQIGQTQTNSNVAVSGGVFTVTLDFGANAFSGAGRFLEISARPGGAAAFTLLTPRQQLTSTPYAVRSLNTATADTATNAQQLGGIAAAQYVKTSDTRLSDQRDPKTGSSNYVQNATSQQASTNFNISGNGTAGGTLSGSTVNAGTQYNLGGQKVLSMFNSNLLKLGSDNGNIVMGPTIAGNYKLEINSPDKNGLWLRTQTPGGSALSIAGLGDFDIDTPQGVYGGRFIVKENGNVGIGIPTPTSKLQVAGTVESMTGGFKFPDGSVQTSAALNPAIGNAFTTGQIGIEAALVHNNSVAPLISLMLPPGVYLVTATVTFENQDGGFFQNNARVVRCFFPNNDFSTYHLGAPGSPMDLTTTTVHTLLTQSATGSVSLSCGIADTAGQVVAKWRRMTAIRVADNPQ
jgi:hypothetical protein